MRRATSLLLAFGLGVSACATGAEADDEGAPRSGGTLYVLGEIEQLAHLDPQRVYEVSAGAAATAFLLRSLVMLDPDDASPTGLLPDLATDTGRPNEDATVWEFTLREDAVWQDGSPVTCEQVAYGVSRSFATDVITDGPLYSVDLLDIPVLGDESSAYKGPYDGTGQELFDDAVACDGQTIRFRLKRPQVDFGYVAAYPAFGPVKPEADTGERYTDAPLATGPYRIEEYLKGERLVLVRNEAWHADSDPYRPAYPDRVEYRFGLDPLAVDEQIISGTGDARHAIKRVPTVEASNLARVFDDPALEDRRLDVLDPFVLYVAINTAKVPVLEHRQAILAAMNRRTVLAAAGGDFAGQEGDGVIKPTLGIDYTPTGLWTDLLGREVPLEGDPELARQLIEQSGEPMPDLVYDYPATAEREAEAAAFVQALTDAGISVTPNPIEGGLYYATVLDAGQQSHLSWAGWGPDWSNASTVIQPLFGANGSFNLSRLNQGGLVDDEFQASIDEALTTTDRSAQAAIWQSLNQRAVELALVAPTVFTRTQTVWGSGLAGVRWSERWGYLDLTDISVTDDAGVAHAD
jgi:peptide/nickel transport system substrate-binding protein